MATATLVKKQKKTQRKQRTTSITRLTATKRLDELKALVGICFILLEDKDDKEICNLTGLHLSTVKRYRNNNVSLHSEFGTIQSFGIAAGIKIEMNEYGYQVRLIK